MHDIKWIRENPEAFDSGLARRGLAPLSASLLALDDRRRAAIAKAQNAQERRNAASKDIGTAMKAGDGVKAAALKQDVADLKTALTAYEEEERSAIAALDAALAQIPNIPLADVPDGKDENDNPELRAVGAKPEFTFAPKEHFEIGEALGLMDFEAAAKISGARFVVLKGALARLERALGQFMLDLHTGEHGYTEVNPPLLVRDAAMFGTAQLPKFRDDQFPTFLEPLARLEVMKDYELRRGDEKDAIDAQAEVQAEKFVEDYIRGAKGRGLDERYARNLALRDARYDLFAEFDTKYWNDRLAKETLWLIPTAEVPLTNLVRESIIEEKQLPLRVTACTPCFRAEAGAAGRDTRGMIRQHQFSKVELVSVTTPEQSHAEHERMLASAEAVLKRLGLAYRVMTLCTGDMGFASQKTYDIEVWLPGQGRYREISSCSLCGEFQARRMEARYRPEGSKTPRFVHTLNGSGIAVGRALVAVLENYQNADGSVTVPEVLLPYMGGMTRLAKTG
jgi:seryl-tRNA synthetase